MEMQIRREKSGEWDVFHLSGSITEDAVTRLIALYGHEGRKCVFNFKNVSMINSNGIRAWVLFLRDFATDRVVELDECSPVIVSQINMLPSFRQKSKVRSVYVPYVCRPCNVTVNVLVAAKDFPKSNADLKSIRCTSCQEAIDVSDEDEFFEFVAREQR